MSIKQAIIDHLKANAGVTAFVGDRIFPEWVRGPVPYVTITLVSHTHTDGLNHPVDVADVRFDINMWCAGEVERELLSQAIRLALHGRHHFTVGAVELLSVFVKRAADFPEPATDGSPRPAYRRQMEIRVRAREATTA